MRTYLKQTCCLALMTLTVLVSAASDFNSSRVPLAYDLQISEKDMLLKPQYIYNFSGSLVVRPDVRQIGFGNIFTPPYLANPFSAKWTFDGMETKVADYTWQLPKTVLHGRLTDHVDVYQLLAPLADTGALGCKLDVENRDDAAFKTVVRLEIQGKIDKEDSWGWMPPAAYNTSTNITIQDNAFVFSSSKAELTVMFDTPPQELGQTGTASFSIELGPKKGREIVVVMVLGQPRQTLDKAKSLRANLPEAFSNTYQQWNNKSTQLESRLPRLVTDNENLQRFYQRGLLTFLTCQWNLQTSVFTPWYCESGIDGGAVCNYLWGDAYISKLMTLADPAAVRALLVTSMNADYSKHYAINFADGRGLGVGYSYDYYSMALLAYDYIAMTGDTALLNEIIRGKPFIDALYEYVFEREDMTKDPELIDYGLNENLLELRRTQAYQHYTPSPNLERICSYQMINEMFGWIGRKAPADLNRRADQLRQVIVSRLWNEDLKWFHCLDKNQKPRLCWSIQIFDMLRANVLSRQQAEGLVGHLNEKEFLSRWGVHSMSKLDPGYDPNDIDWGGPGVYAGDAPELATDLLHAGFVREGIDILQRILWWADFPYIPQAVRADARDYRHDGRANVIAALAGPQAIVFGLFGIRIDGEKLVINPVRHSYTAGMKVENLNIRRHRINIAVALDGQTYSVDVDGSQTQKKIGQPYELKFAQYTN